MSSRFPGMKPVFVLSLCVWATCASAHAESPTFKCMDYFIREFLARRPQKIVLAPEAQQEVEKLAEAFREQVLTDGPEQIASSELEGLIKKTPRVSSGATTEREAIQNHLSHLVQNPKLELPPTKPTSNVSVYLVRGGGTSKPVAYAKVFHGHDGWQMLAKEVEALQILKGLGLTASEPVRILEIDRLITDFSHEPMLLMSRAPGDDLERLVRSFHGAKLGSKEAKTLADAYSAAGEAMAELHWKLPASSPADPKIAVHLDHEASRLIQAAEYEGTIAKFAAKYPGEFGEKQVQAAQDRLRMMAVEYKKGGIPYPALAHGDAHPGNFAYSSESRRFSIFDAQSLAWSVTKQEGKLLSIGDAAGDVGRFLAGLQAVAIDSEISAPLATELRERFMDAYLAKASSGRAADYVRSQAFAKAVDFHQTRFKVVMLQDTAKLSEATRRTIFKTLLSNR